MSTEGFDKLDNLLKERNYQELSAKEKEYVDAEIGGEKAYKELQALAMQLTTDAKMSVSPSVKADLMRNFKRKHRPAFISALEYRTPIYLNVAASILLAFIIYWIAPTKSVEVIKTVTQQLPPRIDTVTVQTPADTIYINKTIRVNVPVYVAAVETKESKESELTGSTLKDQKALMDLLSETSP